jgi:hypothetical protein
MRAQRWQPRPGIANSGGEAAFQMLLQRGKESWHTKSFRKSRKTPALVRGASEKFRHGYKSKKYDRSNFRI